MTEFHTYVILKREDDIFNHDFNGTINKVVHYKGLEVLKCGWNLLGNVS